METNLMANETEHFEENHVGHVGHVGHVEALAVTGSDVSDGVSDNKSDDSRPFILDDQGRPQVDSHITVLKKQDYQALLSAEALLKTIEDRALSATEEAKQVYQAERERGYAEGLAEGVASGKKEYVRDAVWESNRKKLIMVSAENDIMGIIKSVTKRIIAEMPDDQLVTKLARAALEQSVHSNQMVLRVANANVKALKDAVDALLQDYPTVQTIDVRSDKNLGPTDCILETSSGLIIDASLSLQLEGLETALKTEDTDGAAK